MSVGIFLDLFSQNESISFLSSPNLAAMVIFRNPKLSRTNDIEFARRFMTHYESE